MKNIMITIIAIVALATTVVACTNKQVGTAGGAVLGGVAGNALTGGSTAGTIAGAAGGALVGNAVTHN